MKDSNYYRNKLSEAITKERLILERCDYCKGVGWFYDDTYIGCNISCNTCYGTGLPKKKVDKIIRKAFKKFVKEVPE